MPSAVSSITSREKNKRIGRMPQAGELLHVCTVLRRQDLEALKKKTGETSSKEALSKAVEIALKS